MTCKCNLKLENKKFKLNIDLSLYQKLDLFNADNFWPGTIGPYPEQLENHGNNIYSTRRASVSSGQISYLQQVISSVKNSFLCDCLKSKIDLIKFVLADPRDSNILRRQNAGVGVAAGVPRCNNIIIINTYNAGSNTLDISSEQLKKILTHEIAHLMDGCYPCRSKNNNDLFNTQKNTLYKQYKLIYKDIKNFHKQFTQYLITNNLIELKPGYDSIISEKFAFKELDYALTSKDEFLAVFTQFFCFEMAYNNILIENSYVPKNPIITDENIRALYILQFNQKYKNLIQQVCELYNRLQSDPNNCNENLTSNIECSLSLSCGSSILIRTNLCCNSYNIYLDIDSDAGCCDAKESDQKKNPIFVGSILLMNECKCYYLFSPQIDVNQILKLVNNCCDGIDLYPFNTSSKETEDFVDNLSDQIYTNLKNIIENETEARLFLNSIPCD